ERSRHDLRGDRAAADHHVEARAGDVPARRQVGETDAFLDPGGLRTAGHRAEGRAVDDDLVSLPRDAGTAQLESGESPGQTLALLLGERVAPDEIPFVHLQDKEK